MKIKKGIIILLLLIIGSCKPTDKTVVEDTKTKVEKQQVKRFFNDNSFWNQPINKNAKIDAKSDYWINLLERDPSGENIGLNIKSYTIPIYEIDSKNIPFQKMGNIHKVNWYDPEMTFYHQIEFDSIGVPMLPYMKGSAGADQHIAVVDWNANRAWDMFLVKQSETGEWSSATGITYELDGLGVFDQKDFDVKVNESIHTYGPGVAAGTPIIAGIIRYDEVQSGEIRHKIQGALRFVAYQEYTYPATWTDGNYKGGIPEGATLQLDPSLDLAQFNLTDGELVVAKAMQSYGIVIIDYSVGTTIRAEWLDESQGRSWDGILRGWGVPGGIKSIPVKHYRVLDVGNVQKGGDRIKAFFTKDLYLKGENKKQ